MKLEDTVDMMLSDDPKERLKTEYCQLVNKRDELLRILAKHAEDRLDFVIKTPLSLLGKQITIMNDYLTLLEARAAIEGISLDFNAGD